MGQESIPRSIRVSKRACSKVAMNATPSFPTGGRGNLNRFNPAIEQATTGVLGDAKRTACSPLRCLCSLVDLLAVGLRCNHGKVRCCGRRRPVNRIDDRKGPATHFVVHASKIFAQHAHA